MHQPVMADSDSFFQPSQSKRNCNTNSVPGMAALAASLSSISSFCDFWGPAGLAVKPLDLHVVNVGSIPTGPTHGEV